MTVSNSNRDQADALFIAQTGSSKNQDSIISLIAGWGSVAEGSGVADNHHVAEQILPARIGQRILKLDLVRSSRERRPVNLEALAKVNNIH